MLQHPASYAGAWALNSGLQACIAPHQAISPDLVGPSVLSFPLSFFSHLSWKGSLTWGDLAALQERSDISELPTQLPIRASQSSWKGGIRSPGLLASLKRQWVYLLWPLPAESLSCLGVDSSQGTHIALRASYPLTGGPWGLPGEMTNLAI